MRADVYISQILNISRNKASELIKNGKILLNNKPVSKPSDEIEGGEIALLDEIYVGRGALKLKSFLASENFEILGKNALDIGSSTGGFIQILLKNGVESVLGVDVGSSQLDESLKTDKRVKISENTDIRELKINEKFSLITCDVSFISVMQILNSIDSFAKQNALIIILFKPQFEVGRDIKRDKRGVVMDKKAIKFAKSRFLIECTALGWILKSEKECEIKGKEGNAEFFYAFNKR